MDESCVPADTRSLAADLVRVAAAHRLALGGGTACALRLGHRTSRDLDLFAIERLDPPVLLADLEALGERRLRGISDRELSVVVRGVEVSATSLGREPLRPPDEWLGLSVLSAGDLAELKVEAAVRRGMVRDLCDLHLLCAAGEDLAAAIRAGPIDAVVALKAITDPDRFRDQPEPDLRVAWSIDEAIEYFVEQARGILRA